MDDDVGKRVGVEFLHDVGAMRDYRGDAYVKFVGNLFVDESF